MRRWLLKSVGRQSGDDTAAVLYQIIQPARSVPSAGPPSRSAFRSDSEYAAANGVISEHIQGIPEILKKWRVKERLGV
jgi:hypothetical protein